MSLEEKLAKELAIIEETAKIIADSQKKYAAARKQHDKIFKELNAENLENMGWLIQNPMKPGSEKAIHEKIYALYGTPYSGPNVSGYIHDGDYNPIQVNVKFSLEDHSEGKIRKDQLITNCKHFVENYVKFFKTTEEISSRWTKEFPETKVIGFQFYSRDSGLDYLGYDPVENTWYHYTVTYSKTDAVKKFSDIDEALNFAYDFANTKDESDEDDY